MFEKQKNEENNYKKIIFILGIFITTAYAGMLFGNIDDYTIPLGTRIFKCLAFFMGLYLVWEGK